MSMLVPLALGGCALVVGDVNGTLVTDAGTGADGARDATAADVGFASDGADAGEASATDASPDAEVGVAADSGAVSDASDARLTLDATESGTDALDAGDAQVAVDASPPNLLVNPSFTQNPAMAGCGIGWTVSNATLSISTTGRTDQSSCMVCPNGSTQNFAVLSQPTTTFSAPDGGAGWFMSASAWVKPVTPRSDAGNATAWLGDTSGSYVVAQVGTAVPSTVTTWTQTVETWPANDPASPTPTFSFDLAINYAPGLCWLVDDVSMVAVPP